MAPDEDRSETEQGPGSAAFGAARSRRLALGDAADLMEEALARPAAGPRWSSRVSDSLNVLSEAFEDHAREVEGEGGLLLQLLEDAPRLANGINRLERDHTEIRAAIAEATDTICVCSPDCGHSVIDDVRLRVVGVLSLVSRHRQAGADLVYEAYHVDIGGG